MARQAKTNPKTRPQSETVAAPFRRMLVTTDESPAAQAAVALVAEWVEGPGAEVRFVQVTEARPQRRRPASSGTPAPKGPSHGLVVGAATLGARNRQLVRGIAEAAEEFGADVVVLGFDRRRLAGHRLAPSLREQVMRATEVPVLVAPSPDADAARQHGPAPSQGERADAAHRYVRV